MGRQIPWECEHGVTVDGGDFTESHRCEICDAQATEFNRRATTGYDELQSKLDRRTKALSEFVKAAKSWHEFHHKTDIACDWLCECIPAGEEALMNDD